MIGDFNSVVFNEVVMNGPNFLAAYEGAIAAIYQLVGTITLSDFTFAAIYQQVQLVASYSGTLVSIYQSTHSKFGE